MDNNSQDMDRGTRTDNDKPQITTAKALAIGLIVGAIAGLVSSGAIGVMLMSGYELPTMVALWFGFPYGSIGGLVGGCLGSLLSKRTVKSSIVGAIIGGAIIGGIALPMVGLMIWR